MSDPPPKKPASRPNSLFNDKLEISLVSLLTQKPKKPVSTPKIEFSNVPLFCDILFGPNVKTSKRVIIFDNFIV
ncbi:hypothetical protein D3C85_802630 [compost metagenome]